MICINCGKSVHESYSFCPSCGATIIEEKTETNYEESTVAQNEQNANYISDEIQPTVTNTPQETVPHVFGGESNCYNNNTEQQLNAQYFNNPVFTQPPIYNPGRDFAVASMVLGIVSYLLFCSFFFGWPGTFITTITGIVLGAKSIKKSKQAGTSNGMAVAGIITSSVALALVTGICLLYLLLFTMGIEMASAEFMNELI